VCDKADAVQRHPSLMKRLMKTSPRLRLFLFAQGFLISYCKQECGSTSLAWIAHFNKIV